MHSLSTVSIKNFLLKSIDDVLNDKEFALVNPCKNFSRVQKISFRDTMLYPMITTNNSSDIELLDFFPVDKLPSAAALSYRRDQLNVCAFERALKNFNSYLNRDNKYRDMYLVACDGSRINTPYNPNDSNSFIKCIAGRKGINQLHLNSIYDLLNDYYLDGIIQGVNSIDENNAFCQMLARYNSDATTLFIADRAYATYNNYTQVIHSGHKFLFRIKELTAIALFPDLNLEVTDDCFDIEDEINISRKKNKENKNLKNVHFLYAGRTYTSIPAGSPAVDTLKLRLIKILLADGSFEYLVTNLYKDDFTPNEIKDLYQKRWGIETSFRFLKYAESMIHFHSKKSLFLYQEVFAKLISYNFASAILNCVRVTKEKKKHTYTIDKSYLIRVSILFLKGKIEDIKFLVSKKMVPVRKGRKFERKLKTQRADTTNYR